MLFFARINLTTPLNRERNNFRTPSRRGRGGEQLEREWGEAAR